jgi:hypothetical protein
MTTTLWDRAQANAWSTYVWHHLQDLQIYSSNLAVSVGTTDEVVEGWLIGEHRPSPEDCRNIARALSMDATRLLIRAGYAILTEPTFAGKAQRLTRAVIRRRSRRGGRRSAHR